MRTASEAYNAQRDAADMSMTRDFPAPNNPVYRLPDPEDYEHGSLLHRMALRVREMWAEGHAGRAKGEARLQRLEAALDDCEEWLMDVGEPVIPKADEWDDDTDWRTSQW